MCGISGAIGSRDDRDLERVIGRILASQVPRGPDFAAQQSYEIGPNLIVLGHNRLKIIDLSIAANQPMVDSSGQYTIVFNGEIYNYIELKAELRDLGEVFSTDSDTEVILVAYRRWRDDAFRRFFGMFAFAISDARTGEIVLVRDRFGVKPLYYAHQRRRFIFASTAKVIAEELALPPDLSYLVHGLQHRIFDGGERSQYQGVYALSPGSCLRFHPESGTPRIKKHRFYELEAAVSERAASLQCRTYDDLKEEFYELFEDSISLRLRSDVPVGVSISGGVDSTLVAAASSRKSKSIVGYSFGDPSARKSEGPAVASVARSFGMEVRYVWPAKNSERIDLFWRTLAAQDAPFPSTSVMVQNAVFQRARSDGTIVLLGGQAGDEAFMGYRKFFLFYAEALLRSRGLAAFPDLIATLAPALFAIVSRGRLFWNERARYLGKRRRETVLDFGISVDGRPQNPGTISLRDRQMLDITSTSLPTLLRYEDRNSAGNSVESRLPFVDHRLIEFGLALPADAKLKRGYGKWIVRDAAKGLLPDSIRLNRDKRGFDVDEADWLDNGLGSELRAALSERWRKLIDFVPRGSSPDSLFSKARLTAPGNAFLEAVTLIWLGDKI